MPTTPKPAELPAGATAPVTTSLGDNLAATVNGNILTITIDLSQRLRPSASGKTVLVATTGPARQVPGSDVRVVTTAYVPMALTA